MSTAISLHPALTAAPPRVTRAPQSQQRDLAFLLRLFLPYVAIILLLLQVKAGALRLVFPAATVALGYSLYRRNESQFLSFVFWIYMLAPLLRRLVDWRTSYEEQSAILLAPLLLSLLPALHLRRRLAKADPTLARGVLFAISAILLGTGIGFLRHPGAKVLLATATWTAPVVLCLFAATVRERAAVPRVLWRTFFWAIMLLSVYGIVQFVLAPAWDIYWLREVSRDEIAPSFGLPHPFEIRVWSTMNSPGAFASFLGALLVWIMAADELPPLLAQILGYIALLLTLVRGLWIQTAIGMLLLLLSSRRSRARICASVLLFLVAMGLAVSFVPHADVITRRFSSFTSLQQDESYNERQEMYRYVEGVILSTPLGQGLDTTVDLHGFPLDSSLLLGFYLLGWAGAVLYFGGLGLILFAICRDLLRHHAHTPGFTFRTASGVVAIAASFQMVSGDILYRQGGVILWVALGLWACETQRGAHRFTTVATATQLPQRPALPA